MRERGGDNRLLKDDGFLVEVSYLKSLVPDYEFHLVGGSHTILMAQ